MKTPFEELLAMTSKKPTQSEDIIHHPSMSIGQKRAAFLVEETKRLNPQHTDMKKELNKKRIKALNLQLIKN